MLSIFEIIELRRMKALNSEALEKGKKIGYNKAIDDFKEELFKNSERVRPVGWLGYSEIVTCEKIYEIAEQLKAGGKNEQSI